jgi:hypothetical protein
VGRNWSRFGWFLLEGEEEGDEEKKKVNKKGGGSGTTSCPYGVPVECAREAESGTVR